MNRLSFPLGTPPLTRIAADVRRMLTITATVEVDGADLDQATPDIAEFARMNQEQRAKAVAALVGAEVSPCLQWAGVWVYRRISTDATADKLPESRR